MFLLLNADNGTCEGAEVGPHGAELLLLLCIHEYGFLNVPCEAKCSKSTLEQMGKTKSELLYAEVLVKFAKVKKRNKFMYDVTVNQIQSLLNYEKEWYEAASNKLVTM